MILVLLISCPGDLLYDRNWFVTETRLKRGGAGAEVLISTTEGSRQQELITDSIYSLLFTINAPLTFRE
jgi:hypothetical protein